jgi:D-beta-D-heptose 7-phosphate kinase/D-beta-D-heptose 1-phosphate adenosyltransferase
MKELQNTQPQKQLKVLLIGDSCIDRYVYGSCDKFNQEAPVPLMRYEEVFECEGMASNVRNNLSSFDFKIDFITNPETIIKTRYIDSNTKKQILRVDINDKVIQLNNYPKNLIDYNAIVISDYNKGFVTEQLVEYLTKNFAGPIFVDSKRRDLRIFNKCILKINKYEYDNSISLPDNYIVTMGKLGAMYNGEIFRGEIVDMYDPIGAGDVFLSALVYKFLESNDIKESIKFANRAAAISVQHFGTYVLNEQDVIYLTNKGYGNT